MSLTIDLSARETRLLRLAAFSMLGQPRWRSEHAEGRAELLDVYDQTSSGLTLGTALRVEPGTVELLDSALRRLTSELKNYELLSTAAAGQRSGSMVEGFDEELERLFPEAASSRVEMDALVPELIALRRDFSQARRGLAEIAESQGKQGREGRRWWQFWRRERA
jgi:hypothetical protein